MDNQKTIAQFMRFMKQKRAWVTFKTNLKDWSLQDEMPPRPYKTHGGVNVSFYLNECPPELYVSNSFSWEKSPQEVGYWLKIDTDWEDILSMGLDSLHDFFLKQ